MSNEIVNYNPGQASLLEMRADSRRFPRLKSLSREQAEFGLSKIIAQAYILRGQTSDPTNIQFIASTLYGELMADRTFGAEEISLAEIQAVVKRAILTTDIFISVSSLFKVIMEFVKGEGHLNQVQVNSILNKPGRTSSPVESRLLAAAGEFIKEHKINQNL